jgi:phosphoglycerate dehydrogenase-like enzyme
MTDGSATGDPACLIVTAAADEFAAAVTASGGAGIPVRCRVSAQQARDEYAGESVVFGNPAMIRDALPGMPGVAWVQSSWAGVTPLIEYPRRDYVLTGIKDVFGPQMSEYVLGYLLAHELGILRRSEQQRQRLWQHDYSGTLQGKRLCALGTGSIGRHIAMTAAGFGVQVTGVNRSGSAVSGIADTRPVSELKAVLNVSDYVVASLPQTPQTDHLLDAAAIAALPAHAYLINVGRSNLVDDDALMAALRGQRLAGAALDVFDEEPIPPDSPLWDTPNLSITPHIAAVSHPHLIAPIFVDNYARYRKGKPLCHVIDFDTGY